MLAQSVEIIDLFGRRQSCPLQDTIQKWVKSPRHHLDDLMLPTFYVMVFDTRVSFEQTVKQQEHILQGVAQMVMNMETECVAPPA